MSIDDVPILVFPLFLMFVGYLGVFHAETSTRANKAILRKLKMPDDFVEMCHPAGPRIFGGIFFVAGIGVLIVKTLLRFA